MDHCSVKFDCIRPDWLDSTKVLHVHIFSVKWHTNDTIVPEIDLLNLMISKSFCQFEFKSMRVQCNFYFDELLKL